MTDEELAAIAERVWAKPPQGLTQYGVQAQIDRTLLLNEVDRLRAVLAQAKLEKEDWYRTANSLNTRVSDMRPIVEAVAAPDRWELARKYPQCLLCGARDASGFGIRHTDDCAAVKARALRAKDGDA